MRTRDYVETEILNYYTLVPVPCKIAKKYFI